VLTSLAQIHDLKVISRTSVMAYQKRGGRNMREISQALGVANVLEGSVRRTGNRVLVNVQLIDARNDRTSGRSVTTALLPIRLAFKVSWPHRSRPR